MILYFQNLEAQYPISHAAIYKTDCGIDTSQKGGKNVFYTGYFLSSTAQSMKGQIMAK